MAKKRKNYDKANKVIQYIFDKNIYNDAEIDLKYKILRYANDEYKDIIDDNKIKISLGTDSKTRILWNRKEYFVKVYFDEIEYIEENFGLTSSEKSFLIGLSEFIMYETNLLIDKKGNPLTRKTLASELNIRPETISRITKKLMAKKLITSVSMGRNVYYIVNPYIMFKGSKIQKYVIDMFKNMGYVNRSMSKSC